MLCGWGLKAGMVRVWVAGKTVWFPNYHGPYISFISGLVSHKALITSSWGLTRDAGSLRAGCIGRYAACMRPYACCITLIGLRLCCCLLNLNVLCCVYQDGFGKTRSIISVRDTIYWVSTLYNGQRILLFTSDQSLATKVFDVRATFPYRCVSYHICLGLWQIMTLINTSSSSSSLYSAENKNIIFNNTIEIQLAGRQKDKVHEVGAHVIHNTTKL